MDLCKNCGSCHLGVAAIPCAIPVRRCDHCHQLGHNTNFCPLGTTDGRGNVGIAQKYFMVCANCDRWHLPYPCQSPLHHCEQCGNFGHIAVHCPINPAARPSQRVGETNRPQLLPPPQLASSGHSRKRHRPNDDEQDRLMVKLPLAVLDIKHVHPVLVRNIQHHMAGRLTQMLTTHSREDVLALLKHHVPLPQAGSITRIAAPPYSASADIKSEGTYLPQFANQQQHLQQVVTAASPPSTQALGVPVTPQTAQKVKRGSVLSCPDPNDEQVHAQTGTVNGGRNSVLQPLPPEEHSMRWGWGRNQPIAYSRMNSQDGAQHTITGDIYGDHASPRNYQQSGVPTPAENGISYQVTPSQVWTLNTGDGDLNVLATAAAHVTSHGEETLETHDPVATTAQQPNEQYTNAMDFSHLLNSDSASGPSPPGEDDEERNGELQDDANVSLPRQQEVPEEQTEQLNAELQNAAEVQQPKKRSHRKRSEFDTRSPVSPSRADD